MKAMRSIIAALCWMAMLVSCTGLWESTLQGLKTRSMPPAETYRDKALAQEKRGELQAALLTWQVVARLEPQNERTPKIIKTLKRAIDNAARVHYQEGVRLYRNGDESGARREFLITLRLKPDHKWAARFLKKRLHVRPRTYYKVLRGDSFIRIATKIYRDPTKAYIIAYFNDLDPQKPLLAGKTLIMPELEAKYLLLQPNTSAVLDQAQKALEEKHYQEVLELTARIKENEPGHSKARHLADSARYQYGLSLLEKKRNLAAMEQLKKVSPSFKGRNKAIRRARNSIQNQVVAEKMKKAEADLQHKDYAGVINITEEILSLSPDHPEAKALSNTAHYALGKLLIDQNENARAIEVLSAIEKNYEDTAQLMTLAQGRLNAEAETHYRNGVKHFLNEELEKAIQEWKQALALNPKHPKAGQDIENAMRLLDKWRGLEKTE